MILQSPFVKYQVIVFCVQTTQEVNGVISLAEADTLHE